MKIESRDTRAAARAAPRSLVALWLEMIGPPVIWLTQFEIKYALAGKSSAIRHPTLMIAVTVIALALIALLAVTSIQHQREAATSPLDTMAGVERRNRFMARVGLMSSALFALITIAQGTADFFIAPGAQ